MLENAEQSCGSKQQRAYFPYNSIMMQEEQAVKQCREILKRNNLHPMRRLGKGAFSFVFSVEKIELKSAENQVYSVKCINKKQFSKKPYLVKYIEQEIQSMRELDHRSIVRLTRTFQDQGWIFIVMEYCDKGNLYSAQAQKEGGLFTFAECTHILRSVLDGLRHIHERNLIHRDVKAENILLLTDADQPYGYRAKICDLGFCCEDDDNVSTFCGTTSYMAPEIFKKSVYDNKVDVWAIGVLMFRMLFGDFPFKSINMEYQIASKCAKGFSLKRMKVKPNASVSKETFDTLADIFQGIFTVDPAQRMGIEELQKYIFLQPEKRLTASSSTESQSGEEEGLTFQREKIIFVEEVLQEVKNIGFLTNWEEACFQYYLRKIQLTLQSRDTEQGRKRARQLEKAIDTLGMQVENGLKKSTIAKLADYFSPKATQFTEFKQPYRLVVGHVFSKAHRAMSEKVLQRSQVKLGLFCCHLINRIFQKEYRNEIFTHYFDWLKAGKKQGKFEFGTFREWIKNESPQRLVQTVEVMNDKFYRKK